MYSFVIKVHDTSLILKLAEKMSCIFTRHMHTQRGNRHVVYLLKLTFYSLSIYSFYLLVTPQ